MNTVTSADGTSIAYEELGGGPPLIIVTAAFNTRASTEPLAAALQDRFTVLNYDRRGRGGSGDTPPYAVDREIDDIAALIDSAGGAAALFGHSSGATLALWAAARGLPITKLALYEPPFLVDQSRPPLAVDLPDRLAALVAAGRRGDAVELYQTEAVGIPENVVVQLRHAPFRPALEAIAHTLVYDATIVGDCSLPVAMISSITTQSIVFDGELSPPMLRNAARVLAETLPHGRRCTLAGRTHELSPEAIAPPLAAFLAGERAVAR
jgi:pimeloyl-ACP methyl ester carboxylesterase